MTQDEINAVATAAANQLKPYLFGFIFVVLFLLGWVIG